MRCWLESSSPSSLQGPCSLPLRPKSLLAWAQDLPDLLSDLTWDQDGLVCPLQCLLDWRTASLGELYHLGVQFSGVHRLTFNTHKPVPATSRLYELGERDFGSLDNHADPLVVLRVAFHLLPDQVHHPGHHLYHVRTARTLDMSAGRQFPPNLPNRQSSQFSG